MIQYMLSSIDTHADRGFGITAEAFNRAPSGTLVTNGSSIEENNFGDFLSEYELIKRNRKPRVEDTHTRDTYLIRNDLLARFNKLAEKQEKGFKMRMVNYRLEKELDRIKQRQGGGV